MRRLLEAGSRTICDPAKQEADTMQTRNKIFDDLSQLMTNAMGVAQGARTEAETAIKGMVDRFLADRNLVNREEFDAARAMAQKAREENDSLRAELTALTARVTAMESASRKPRKAEE
jgi:BMFP domain-containing protein YqiC